MVEDLKLKKSLTKYRRKKMLNSVGERERRRVRGGEREWGGEKVEEEVRKKWKDRGD